LYLAVNASTFMVGAAQVGQSITVTASYTDLASHTKSVTSAAKSISAPGNGDFAVTRLNPSAPIGASVVNPLTSLVKNPIDLGVSPNEAGTIAKSVLGIAAAIDLQHCDSWTSPTRQRWRTCWGLIQRTSWCRKYGTGMTPSVTLRMWLKSKRSGLTSRVD
jgi:hypothetical protein